MIQGFPPPGVGLCNRSVAREPRPSPEYVVNLMDKKQQEFLKRLRETFRVEADEHLRAMSSGILQLEKGLEVEQAATIEVVFREAHSLKGAARAVDLIEIESVCQSLESVFAALKRGEISLSLPLYDRFHTALHLIGDLLAEGGEAGAAKKPRVLQVVKELGECLRGFPPAVAKEAQPQEDLRPRTESPAGPSAAKADVPRSLTTDSLALPDTVRVSTAKLNLLLVQVEEMLSAKLALGQRGAELREATAFLGSWERERIKIQPELRTLLRGLGKNGKRLASGGPPVGRADESAAARVAVFCQTTELSMKSLQAKLATLAKSAEQDRRALSMMLDRLLEDTRKALMLPFTSFLEAIPLLVRDLARKGGKDVDLIIQGGESEVDRRILEEMKDPLIHLVRNSIDHGIESPQVRILKNKRPQGMITIAISQKEGSKVEILIADDGAGLNLAQVRSSGLKSGAISPQESLKMDDAAVSALIFRSGVSTSPLVTDISGRGLGLAIVREKVDKLGGALAVESRPDLGTSFRITLPLTLTAFRGVLVLVEEHLLIVPSAHVVRALRLKQHEVKSVENRHTIEHEGKVISLVRLGDVLGIPRKASAEAPEKLTYTLVLAAADERIAFVVDEILEEQEVLVKSLGQQLPRVRNITGAAVLGSGKVVPVLNVPDLIYSAHNMDVGAVREAGLPPPPKRQRRLLVAEDSITTRTLLKNVLESAGYTVKTAVDGVDALTSLRAEAFDLVISDVDMPRMNGFGLTSAIRMDKKLAELPVVLVTALDSREDRERGIDVGASAYLVKSSFEQSDLLEVVQRLI